MRSISVQRFSATISGRYLPQYLSFLCYDPFDFEILHEIADENGYVSENDSTGFGFYEASDLTADNTQGSLLGNFNKTGPVPFNVSLLSCNSMDDFRLWVVASHLQKKYEGPNENVLRSPGRNNTTAYCKTTTSNKMVNSAVEEADSSSLY